MQVLAGPRQVVSLGIVRLLLEPWLELGRRGRGLARLEQLEALEKELLCVVGTGRAGASARGVRTPLS